VNASLEPTSPAEQLAAVERTGERRDVSFGGGRMAWRIFGAGRPVVLLHGASGAWNHWVRNIPALAAHYRLYVADMPGYGDSDAPADLEDPEVLGAAIAAGIDAVLPPPARYDLVGFSFGGVLGAFAAARHPGRVERLVVIGPGAMGPRFPELARLRRPAPDASFEELAAVHRENLGIVMFHDPANIDDLAVHMQIANLARSRTRSGRIPTSDRLKAKLHEVDARVFAAWGEFDSLVHPYFQDRAAAVRASHPDADVRMIAGAGHWCIYEDAPTVDAILLEMLEA